MPTRVASVHNVTRGVDLATEVLVADSWLTRARGYLGRREPEDHQGILLVRCKSIHMLGVGFPLDIILLGVDQRVVAVHHRVKPGFRTCRHRDAHSTLELKAGRADMTGTSVGDVLRVLDATRSLTRDPVVLRFEGERT